jgi:chemotaxis-related protein WspB
MLFVLFQLGSDRYALEASQVVEVIPLVALNKLPQPPKGVAGLFVYRGQPVPAVDLSELLFGRPARDRLSTRIIVVNYFSAAGATEAQLLGLIAERATAMMKRDAKDFRDVGVNLTATPYLGPVLTDDQGVIQLVQPGKLSGLAANIRESLTAPASEAGHVTH